jgi:hypothetical protein
MSFVKLIKLQVYALIIVYIAALGGRWEGLVGIN